VRLCAGLELTDDSAMGGAPAGPATQSCMRCCELSPWLVWVGPQDTESVSFFAARGYDALGRPSYLRLLGAVAAYGTGPAFQCG
jgi:hypothetical protein